MAKSKLALVALRKAQVVAAIVTVRGPVAASDGHLATPGLLRSPSLSHPPIVFRQETFYHIKIFLAEFISWIFPILL